MKRGTGKPRNSFNFFQENFKNDDNNHHDRRSHLGLGQGKTAPRKPSQLPSTRRKSVAGAGCAMKLVATRDRYQKATDQFHAQAGRAEPFRCGLYAEASRHRVQIHRRCCEVATTKSLERNKAPWFCLECAEIGSEFSWVIFTNLNMDVGSDVPDSSAAGGFDGRAFIERLAICINQKGNDMASTQ